MTLTWVSKEELGIAAGFLVSLNRLRKYPGELISCGSVPQDSDIDITASSDILLIDFLDFFAPVVAGVPVRAWQA